MEEVLPNGQSNVVVNSPDIKKKKASDQPLSKRQELNNHIVRMRNSVRQARVQIINRLISQIKKYKNRKGSPKDQEKAKRKADRIVQEIQILKKIKKDKVSLFALQDDRQLDDVLNNPGSFPEERVLARLSHHNVIAKDVKRYRDANPNWDKQIPVLLEMTREKRRKKKETLNSGEGPITEIKEPRKIQQSKSNKRDNSYNVGSNSLESESEVDEEIHDHNSQNKSDFDASEEEEEKVKQFTAVKTKINQANKKPKQEQAIRASTEQTATLTSSLNKFKGTVKVKFLTDLNDLEDDNLEEANKKAQDIVKTPQSKRPKSAFFVGGVDEPKTDSVTDFERSTTHFHKSQPFNQNHQNGQSKPQYRKGKLISKPPSNRPQGNFRQDRKGQPPFQRSGPDNRFGGNAEPLGAKKPKFSRDYQKEQFLKPSHSSDSKAAVEKLHPSWEAKKKQQQISLTEFKGKKIVFGDDD